MDIREEILQYQGQPITHQLLASILKGYRRPNDKIKALKDQGVLQPVKRGVYVLGDRIKAARPEQGLMANHLYGPSYVSMETALSHYGLIPERVFTVVSMTIKPSTRFATATGLYTYTFLPLPYYAFGIDAVRLGKDQRALIATREKALADKVVATAGTILRSVSGTRQYLLEDLRMETQDLKGFDLEAMRSWLPDAPKKESLEILIKTIEKL